MPKFTISPVPGTTNGPSTNNSASGTIVKCESTDNVLSPTTDKPRPYVCAICHRSFKRLEHQKRHERSHTKERPFECSECARCFSRRDLLLRHQQKLHWTPTPSSRARKLRESARSFTSGWRRACQNSVAGTATGANSAAASMRPRANIAAAVDVATLQTIESANASAAGPVAAQSCHPSLADFPFSPNPFFGGDRSAAHQGGMHACLPNLDSIPTVPPSPTLDPGFDFEGIFFTPRSTINPSSLQYDDSPPSMAMDQWSLL